MGSPPIHRYGSDYVVELLAEAGVELVAFNPGATFRGIHDSLVNGPDPKPDLVLCTHEGVSVAVAQGYAKATGRPMAVLLHDVVGLQHATMAIYNAWCDRVPVLLVGGAGPMSKSRRRPWIDWIHTAHAQAELVRNYVKWDDQPTDLESLGESFARAWQAAVSAPPGPVYLCLDVELQEQEIEDAFDATALRSFSPPAPPAPSAGELDRLAALLRDATLPAVVAGHVAADDAGFRSLLELATAAQSAVVDDATGVLAFPTDHELNATGVREVLEAADAVILLDVDDVSNALGDAVDPRQAHVVHVTTGHLRLRSWAHDYHPLVPGVGLVSGTGDEAVQGLLHRLCEQPVSEATRQARRERIVPSVARQRSAWRDAASRATAPDAVPLERLVAALGEALDGRRWRLVHGTYEGWERRLWSFTRPRQYLGWHAGGGLGYGPGAAIGAALGTDPGTICVSLQPDGDFLFTPSALWTLAHRRLPVLMVMHNNRQYRNTVEHAAEVARARGRPVERRYEGAALDDPAVDFATLARAFSIWAVGPITAAEDLEATLAEAVDVVAGSRPALVDVVTPGA